MKIKNINKFIDEVERINENLYETFVCIKPKCGIDYNREQQEQIGKEILEIVNAEQTDLFRNKRGEKNFKYTRHFSECGDNPEENEHWLLTNDERELDW